MRKITSLLLLVLIVTLGSCNNDELDEIRCAQAKLADRISSLEAWQKEINENISGLQSVIKALEDKDYVTGVTELADGSGYVINFVKSGEVVIKHGEKGDKGDDGTTPVIGVKQDNGVYYWTLNGEWLTDASGNKLRVSGEKGDKGDKGDDGTTPVISIKQDNGVYYWTLNGEWLTDASGNKLRVTGDKGDRGESLFNGIYIEDNYVIFELIDQTTFKIPVYKPFKIGTDPGNEGYWVRVSADTRIPLSLPDDFKEEDYTGIMAQIISSEGGTNTDIQTRSASKDNLWTVKVEKPTFTNGVYNKDAAVNVTSPDVAGPDAVLEVTLIGNDGSKLVATRILKISIQIGDFYLNDGTLLNKDVELTDDQKAACIGVVCYSGSDAYNNDPLLKEDHPDCTHGLVIALNNSGSSKWSEAYESIQDNWISAEGNPYKGIVNLRKSTRKCGYSNTCALMKYNAGDYNSNVSKNKKLRVLPCDVIAEYNKNNPAPSSSSGWYFPSKRDFNFGDRENNEVVINSISKAGGTTFTDNVRTWTSVESTNANQEDRAVTVFFVSIFIYSDFGYKTEGDYLIRPVLAF